MPNDVIHPMKEWDTCPEAGKDSVLFFQDQNLEREQSWIIIDKYQDGPTNLR